MKIAASALKEKLKFFDDNQMFELEVTSENTEYFEEYEDALSNQNIHSLREIARLNGIRIICYMKRNELLWQIRKNSK